MAVIMRKILIIIVLGFIPSTIFVEIDGEMGEQ